MARKKFALKGIFIKKRKFSQSETRTTMHLKAWRVPVDAVETPRRVERCSVVAVGASRIDLCFYFRASFSHSSCMARLQRAEKRRHHEQSHEKECEQRPDCQ